jgi:hypothetical protein
MSTCRSRTPAGKPRPLLLKAFAGEKGLKAGLLTDDCRAALAGQGAPLSHFVVVYALGLWRIARRMKNPTNQ